MLAQDHPGALLHPAMTPRRSLMISPITPAIGGNGLAMRMGLFADALARVSDTHVLVLPIAGDLPQGAPVSGAFRLHRLDAGRLQVETRFALLSQIADPAERLSAFKDWGRPSQTAGLSRPVLNAVARIVQDIAPDLVHIGRVGLSPCVGVLPTHMPVTLDLDEDDRAAFAMAPTREPHQAAWARQEGRVCDRLIADYGPRAARLYVASRGECTSLSRRHPGLDFAIARNAAPVVSTRMFPAQDRTAIFIGSLSYAPNVQGLVWFIRRVMPYLAGSGFRLEVAGTGAPPELLALARRSGVVMRGWVPNAGMAYRRAALSILPLFSGGGTRIKLLEAAAHGIPFVATRRAASGLDLPSESGWFADDPRNFALCIRTILSDPATAGRRAAVARRHVGQHHDRATLIRGLAQDLDSMF